MVKTRRIAALLALGIAVAGIGACTPSERSSAPPSATRSAPPSPRPDPCAWPHVEEGGDADLALVPQAVSTQVLRGEGYRISETTAIGALDQEGTFAAPARYLADLLKDSGHEVPVLTGLDGATATIRLCPMADGPAESYRILSTEQGLWIEASDRAGAFDAVATLRQLLPPAPQADQESGTEWMLPAFSVDDAPRYRYRGMMLDVARSFFPPDDVKVVIDTMALYKLNYLHLHLSDDQGWRIAIGEYPQLTEVGASYQSGGKHGGPWFYQPQEYRDLVDYAAARGIAIVPELDGPGHVNAAQSAYGSLTCDGQPTQPYTGHDVGFSMYCLSDDAHAATVRDFLESAWGDLAAQTPGAYLHVGGDEAMKATPETYGRYAEMAGAIVSDADKRLMAWQQFGAYPLPKGSVLQYWGTNLDNRSIGGTESAGIGELRAGLKQGARIVMSPADRAYMDQCYDSSTPVGTNWAGCITPRMAYEWDPDTYISRDGSDPVVPAGRVLGVEATLFSDHLYQGWASRAEDNFLTPLEYFGSMGLPRLPALAEVAWSAQDARSWGNFKARLTPHTQRWDAAGLTYYDPANW